ncbi:MAG: sensor histidine kinase, partial [Xanthomonadales bacterium]|nr:sensor histidine kinase [Xanthomonadales bacterium]
GINDQARTCVICEMIGLSMAIHELTTNAAKYGALSVPDGHLQVSWEARQRDGRLWLHMVWTESDGPPVHAGKRRGFGTRLIAEGVPYELGGKVTLELAATGAICHFDVPINHQPQGKTR